MKKLALLALITFSSFSALEDPCFNPTKVIPSVHIQDSIDIEKIDSPIYKPLSDNIWSSKDFRFFMGTVGVSMLYGAVIGGWIGSHWYAHCE